MGRPNAKFLKRHESGSRLKHFGKRTGKDMSKLETSKFEKKEHPLHAGTSDNEGPVYPKYVYVDERGKGHGTDSKEEAYENGVAYSTMQYSSKPISKKNDRLTYQERKNLPRKDFAEPDKRKYPVEDKIHARNALARVSQHGTPQEKREVRAAVKKRYPMIKQSP